MNLGPDIQQLLSSSDLNPSVASSDALEGDVIGDRYFISDISHVRVGGEAGNVSLIHRRRVNSDGNILGNCLLAKAGAAIHNHSVNGSLALGDGDNIGYSNRYSLAVDSFNSSGLARDGCVVGSCLNYSTA